MIRATAALVVLAAIALAAAAAPADAATPYMDRVEAAMRRVSPDLEGLAYRRTHNNRIVGYDGRPDSWILQTPDCWGQRACRRPVGIPRFLKTLERDLAKARTLVDLTTMIPFPFGQFYRAIVRGLRRAYAAGNRPMIRVLGGCDPPCAPPPGLPSAQAYADQLAAAIGGDPTVIVASHRYPGVRTPDALPSLSWNHSKTITIDDRVALVGGHNLWSSDYVQGHPEAPVINPVHDVTIRVEGPVTRAVHAWANVLWRAACAAASATASGAANGASVGYGAGTPRTCPAEVRPPRARGKGTVDVLGFGRLGLLGVKAPSAATTTGSRGPDDPAPCPSGLPWYSPGSESPDWTNDPAFTPAYDRRNPAETGLRTLIASARSSVFIAQQDLHGICNPPQPGVTPNFDRRLLDVIAGRLLAGVDVRVVISTPGAAVSDQEAYSNSTSLSQTADAIRARTRTVAADAARADRAIKDHFRLAGIRFSDSPVWPAAPRQFNKIANHSKLGMVDTCAIWVGSHNLYPFWLSEYSLLIEDRRAARTFKRDYADPLWRHSAGGGPLPGRPCAPRPRQCLASRSPIGPRNIGRLRLGYTRRRLLRVRVRPAGRMPGAVRYCVRRSRGHVTAVFGRHGRLVLVTTTARGHRMRHVGPGAPTRRLRRRFWRGRDLAPGLFRAGPHSRRLFGFRRDELEFVAVVDRRLLRRPRALRLALRRGLRAAQAGAGDSAGAPVSSSPARSSRTLSR